MLLDYVFLPHPEISWETSLFFLKVNFWSMILGPAFVSKFLFVSILLLSGYLGIQMGDLVSEKMKIDKKWKNSLRYAGIAFCLINPFLYERMMTQPGVYLAIVLVS